MRGNPKISLRQSEGVLQVRTKEWPKKKLTILKVEGNFNRNIWRKPEFTDGMLSGSEVNMNEKTSYDLFYK